GFRRRGGTVPPCIVRRRAAVNSDETGRAQSQVAAVILAAGLGTRMKSRIPKELQPLAGRPVIDYVLRAIQALSPLQTIVVLSPAKAGLAERLPPECEVAWQRGPRGTGRAAAQALPLLRPAVRQVVVLVGDHPRLSSETAEGLVDTAIQMRAVVTLRAALVDDPAGYGRVRREGGRIVGV